jgi:hypothetical protein
MKEALGSSETSVLTRATLRNIPEDTILHSHCRENLKSYIPKTVHIHIPRRAHVGRQPAANSTVYISNRDLSLLHRTESLNPLVRNVGLVRGTINHVLNLLSATP